ncbi:hypothetical protein [Methylocystis bryophila]|uniref:Uncharacterized protein n=1 Tax=Methylocystis bryophila TaxID=655015 RepID=A0A1W6MQA1_9HYPH|nr:hypothetical protein [Methylocystis bryophila]ARN79773.1 hypothetical protein B1812_00370 [Methylocystis bryophila]BDV39650.1 hypothetical protein DSM21852_29030 [Methylocystis bryophila]
MLRLESLIPCSLVAQERLMVRKSSAEDGCAGRAIFALVTLAAELSGLNGTPVHERLERLWEAEEDRAGERDRFSEIVTEELFAVGFTFFPASATELVERIASRIERESCWLAA